MHAVEELATKSRQCFLCLLTICRGWKTVKNAGYAFASTGSNLPVNSHVSLIDIFKTCMLTRKEIVTTDKKIKVFDFFYFSGKLLNCRYLFYS